MSKRTWNYRLVSVSVAWRNASPSGQLTVDPAIDAVDRTALRQDRFDDRPRRVHLAPRTVAQGAGGVAAGEERFEVVEGELRAFEGEHARSLCMSEKTVKKGGIRGPRGRRR